ncbi:MAG: hypothetical protein AAF970_19290 [Bacteroidota bacterium]
MFSSKLSNSSGLQLASLVAHPISRYVLLPEQPNAAYEVLSRKLPADGVGFKLLP